MRWAAAWVFLAAWLVALMLDLGGGLANLLLVLAVLLLLYELLAADGRTGS